MISQNSLMRDDYMFTEERGSKSQRHKCDYIVATSVSVWHCGTSDEFPCSADKAHGVAASRNQCFAVVTSTQTQVTLSGKHCLFPRRSTGAWYQSCVIIQENTSDYNKIEIQNRMRHEFNAHEERFASIEACLKILFTYFLS